MLHKSLLLLVTLLASTLSPLFSQQLFERRTTTASNIRLAITNVGVLGKPDVRNNPAGDPSWEYPADTGTEHLFEAGLWIGGFRNGGDLLLSSMAVTNPTGYTTGRSGYEFTNDGSPITEISSLPESPNFSPLAVSHQDIIAEFSDRRVAVETGTASIPIAGHEQPMFIDARLEAYNWNFSFSEAFVILKYTLKNTSTARYDSVYVGMYSDIVIRNVNTTIETGGNFFNKNGLGHIDSLYTNYVFDAGSTDNPSINTYAAKTILGTEYRGEYFHPSNSDTLNGQIGNSGLRTPEINPSFWLFSGGSGTFAGPEIDQDRYNRMSQPSPLSSNIVRNALRTDGVSAAGNYLSEISIGPFPEWEPDEEIVVYFAFVNALKPDAFQNLLGKREDTEETRALLNENIGWAFRSFRGEDVNNNGRLDIGEDVNGNGVLDRFLVPEPPATPKLRVELEAGKAVLYWDRAAESSVDPVSGEVDFEGYKVYRSNLGDDLNGTITTRRQVIREYDIIGNTTGFNNGFSEVALSQPARFDGDDTDYWYRLEVGGLLNGWQYQFAVTSFDQGSGDENLPSLESSLSANAVRVFPGTSVNDNFGSEEFKVGVYPNPYRVNAAWDGGNELTRKVIFYNLPKRASIRVYTLAGDRVAELEHDADTYNGDSRWFSDLSSDPRVLPGGEHAWDLLSESNQILSSGLYLYTVKDLDSGKVQTGKLVIIK